MGLFDAIIGRRKIAGPAPDRLFAITTAYITLETEHQISSRGVAAIVFQPLATGDFERIAADMEDVLRGDGRGERARRSRPATDSFGYRWMIVRDPDVEDLAVGINAVSDQLALDGYARPPAVRGVRLPGRRRRARSTSSTTTSAGTWYPFSPAGDAAAQERATERELRLRAVIGADLPIEPELDRWFPLWGIPI